MNILGRLTVVPQLPEALIDLAELARNLYWTWSPESRALFRSLDEDLWEATGHNPVTMLRDIKQDKLELASTDKQFLKNYKTVMTAFKTYLSKETWFDSLKDVSEHKYAYFCAEYGWHEAVALYSGGLGVLAGDHTKAASDLGIPLVGIGLWYPEGYFHQRIDPNGQQEAAYERKQPLDLPLHPVQDEDGNEIRVSVTLTDRHVSLRAWEVKVGRVSVYLLDTDVPENSQEDRDLLVRLYGGDQRTRIAQEIILGIGGVRLLRALGIAPSTWHMNEGHSAFMALERCREFVQQGLSFNEARELVTSSTVFTVHTPVAAGNDAFPFDLVSQFFGGFWGELGLNQEDFLELARHNLGWGPVFSMPALALRFSAGRNGVAELHGDTSRRIWNDLWPEVPTDEVPIGHVTNGVHYDTWVAPEIQDLVNNTLVKNWKANLTDAKTWKPFQKVDNQSLWEARQTIKKRSVRFLRRRVLKQLTRHGATPTAKHGTDDLLNPNTLTIGFARRFATYKRATLIFADMDRLERILNNPERPVQLLFSGKAHPADKPGQELIKQIQQLSQNPRFKGKILFVEDYDMAAGRALTSGVDVWLNNPRRPLEASGTSGQKAAMNGVLNLSILDGWWPEGYNGLAGWAIGTEENITNDLPPEQKDASIDNRDVDSLYNLLEKEVVPLYYNRDKNNVPNGWLERSKNAIATCSPKFSSQRQVKDYVNQYYAPASRRNNNFTKNNNKIALELAEWRQTIKAGWHSVYLNATANPKERAAMNDKLEFEAIVHPKTLSNLDLRVELVYSAAKDELKHNLITVPMTLKETLEDGAQHYTISINPTISGQLVYGIRVYPYNKHLASPFDVGAIRWA